MTSTRTRDSDSQRTKRLVLGLLVLTVAATGMYLAWSMFFPGLVARGQAAYRLSDWSSADRLARERLLMAPADQEALRLLARASVRLGRFAEASGIYSRLPERALDAEDRYLRGLTLVRTGQFDVGQQEWRAALSADPGHPETLQQMAQLALARGQVVEGASAARRLAQRPGWEARGDLLLGMIEASDHNPGAAAVALGRALKRDPEARLVANEPQSARKLLARTLIQVGKSQEAQDILQPALAAGSDPEIFWLLSRAYLQQGMSAQAAAALSKSGTYRAEHPIEPEPSPYVGEARCELCHQAESQAVQASRHGRTLPLGRDLEKLPLPDANLKDPVDSRVTHRLRRSEGKIVLETRVDDRVYRAVAAYALGATDRYSTLIGRDEEGATRTLRLSYYRGSAGQGWDLTKNLPQRPRQAKDFLGEPFVALEGAGECLSCHTTTVRSFQEKVGPEANDRGIGCERCHGPGALHLSALTAKFPDPTIATPAQAAPKAVDQLCGKCHSQHFLAMPAARTDPLWARFPSSTLSWSRCYTESGGALHCTTCHDPHRDAETSADYYVVRCLSCHAGSSTNPSVPPPAADKPIRRGCPINPAKDCLRCHMPKVPYRQMHIDFTDHYIRVSREQVTARN